MDTIAFALRAEYAGTTPVEKDGHDTEVPTFQGGLLNVGDGDINLGEALEAGDGHIVVQANDQQLADLLRAVPVLKEVATPEGATPISPYERLQADAVRTVAQARDIKGAASASKERLLPILAAHDEALAAGDLSAARQIAEQPENATAIAGAALEAGFASGGVVPAGSGDGSGERPDPPVDSLSTEQLAAVVDNDTETFPDAGKVVVPAAIDELRSRAKEGDDAAARALIARDLNDDSQEA